MPQIKLIFSDKSKPIVPKFLLSIIKDRLQPKRSNARAIQRFFPYLKSRTQIHLHLEKRRIERDIQLLFQRMIQIPRQQHLIQIDLFYQQDRTTPIVVVLMDQKIGIKKKLLIKLSQSNTSSNEHKAKCIINHYVLDLYSSIYVCSF